MEPVNYTEQIKEAAESELKSITSGTKSCLAPAKWKPVAYKAKAPADGVILRAGVFNDCFTRNIAYLNHCFASPNYCDNEVWRAMFPGSN